jgi:histidinol-phosphatase
VPGERLTVGRLDCELEVLARGAGVRATIRAAAAESAAQPKDRPVTSDISADLALAHRLADAARSVTMPRFRGPFSSRNKADGSLVTEVDEAAEDAIRAIVARERPRDAFLGEERGETGSGHRRWIVDAIDGTSSFAAGTTGWGTLIALEIDGGVAIGICEMSPTAKRYWATRGGGAYVSRNGAPDVRLEVNDTAALAAARCFVTPPMWARTDAARAMSSALRAATLPYEQDEHPALEVAAGSADLCVFFTAGPWDLAAPSLVVEEAGGRFTDIAGGRTLTGGAVFSNGRLHDAAMELLQASLAR